ncbi:FtsX-like permease family protein [Nonomuraea sp. NPDC049152]|uniref:FtsX-like permease family protein n=1 Tax=Nonomuraea sp. NPDC049152 TaxID=3154350 RepID=UPI0033C7CAFF
MRVALRISRRDAFRAKGRTALIMVMIGLPVLVITGLLTFAATAGVTTSEGLVRDLGAADLRVKTTQFNKISQQYGDSGDPGSVYTEGPKRSQPTTTAEVAARLRPGTRLIGFDEGGLDVWSADGYDRVSAAEIDLRDPLAKGMRPLVEGRYPAGPDEVVVTQAMPFRAGDTIKVTRANRQVRVVGVVAYPFSTEHTEVVGFKGVLLLDRRDGMGTGWLADTPSPATLEDTRRLNEIGLVGLSALTADDHERNVPTSTAEVMSIALVVFMVAAETVLLAGPAFAIGLRRRRTELAMIAAQGATGAQLRTIVLADGLVLGGAAAVPAAVVGTAGGLLLVPLLSGSVGPAEVPWWQVLGVAALGLLSGVVAAMVPALQAARQDTAAVLAGRPGVTRDRAGKPVLGLVLLVAGIVAIVLATRTEEVWIFAAAMLGLLGMVALTPWLVKFTGRFAVRLPLALRLSVRDAVRHRVRTASAVAAVMTATAGAITVGIGIYSQDLDAGESYRSAAPVGTLTISAVGADDAEWAKIREAANQRMPGVTQAGGFRATNEKGQALLLFPQRPFRCVGCGSMFFDVTIGDQRLLDLLQGGHDPRTAAAFAEGKAVVFDPAPLRKGKLRVQVGSDEGAGGDKTFEIPAVVGKPADRKLGVVLVPPAVVSAKGWTLKERELYARYQPKDVDKLQRELTVLSPYVGVSVEQGYRRDIGSALLVLMGAALILVLGGTLVATALAAADMRPDLATVSAVGAPAKTGRLVVAGQAGYVAGLGALVGAIAGVVPGVALAWVMTTGGGIALSFGPFMVRQHPGPATIAVPWSLVGVLVVGLPLLAALVAGAFARTRTLTVTRRLT